MTETMILNMDSFATLSSDELFAVEGGGIASWAIISTCTVVGAVLGTVIAPGVCTAVGVKAGSAAGIVICSLVGIGTGVVGTAVGNAIINA